MTSDQYLHKISDPAVYASSHTIAQCQLKKEKETVNRAQNALPCMEPSKQ